MLINNIYRPMIRKDPKGVLIIIEGIDGTGKATITKKLVEHISEKYPDKECIHLSYPNYESENGKIISKYLNNEIQMNKHDLYKIFANDRFNDYLMNWKEKFENGAIVIADRYTFSNLIHNVDITPGEMLEYEFLTLGLPRPHISFILRVDDIDIICKRLEKRNGNKHDGNDIDINETRENLLRANNRLTEIIKYIHSNSEESYNILIDDNDNNEVECDKLYMKLYETCDKFINKKYKINNVYDNYLNKK